MTGGLKMSASAIACRRVSPPGLFRPCPVLDENQLHGELIVHRFRS